MLSTDGTKPLKLLLLLFHHFCTETRSVYVTYKTLVGSNKRDLRPHTLETTQILNQIIVV